MKKTLFFLVLLLGVYNLQAQCPTQDVILDSQADVDAFVATYSTTCTDIPVSVKIEGNVTSISGLDFITSIQGNLVFSTNSPVTYNGLHNLEYIGGNFRISSNTYFNSFTGLTALERIEGDIQFICVDWNESDVSGINLFSSLSSIGGDLKVEGSPNCSAQIDLSFINNLVTIEGKILVDIAGVLSGLTGLETIGSDLLLYGADGFPPLPNLTNIGGEIEVKAYPFVGNAAEVDTNIAMVFPNLQSIAGSINMPNQFPGLTTVDNINLNSLTSIGGDINIVGEDGLTVGNISINSLTNMNGNIRLIYMPLSTTSFFSMDSLQTLGGNIYLSLIFSTNLAFGSLYEIGGDFVLYNADFAEINLDEIIPLVFTVGGNVDLTSNDGLLSLDGLENLQNVGGNLTINNNPNLDDCAAICNFIANNTNYALVNVSVPCQTTSATCTANTITGTVLLDFDADGCTINNDFPFENIEVVAYDGINYYTTFTDENGVYTIIVPEGTFDVYIETSAQLNTTPVSQNITITGTDNVDVIDFCTTYSEVFEDISITFVPLNDPVVGFDANYSVVLQNHGTTLVSGTIDLNFDDDKLDFAAASIAPTTQITNLLTWNYTNLIPGETRSFTVNFDVMIPPAANINDNIAFSVLVPLNNDITPNNNFSNLYQTLVASYDPNDKTVLEGKHLLIDDIDEYLHYVIRFQNEGTSPAVNIRIKDLMSDMIDWDTFEPVDASHDYYIALTTGADRELEFFFDNINLPDSTTDEPNSHGFVAFRVKPKSTVQIGDIIDNRAAIYFDFNAPIITNKTETRIVEDTDSDTIYNYLDNCPDTPNTDQADQDGDGMGDVCDDDSDGDDIPNVDDNCADFYNPAQEDFDEDGIGDLCDDDDDNDNILDVDDDCPYYSGSSADGCPFTLPVDNYIIQAISETCANLNNAKIDIKAIADYTYEIEVSHNGTLVALPVASFTESLLIENLDAGTYEVCFGISAENYSQCFTVEIGDPAELTANAALSRSNEYSIDLLGATNYSIFINGEKHTVIAPSENTLVTFTKQLTKPVNTVEVQTEKACQGKFTEMVKTVSNANFVMLPNPSNDYIYLSLLNAENTTNATMTIYDVSGRLLFQEVIKTPVNNQKIDIQQLKTGVYFVQLATAETTFTQKLIKK